MRNRVCLIVFTVLGLVFFALPSAFAWEHHPLFTEPMVSTMPQVSGAAPVAATPLETFLAAEEADLVALLASEEAWARANMSSYAPRPDTFAFQATGNANDIRDRFLKAIRVNPNIKTPLYVSPLASGKAAKAAQLAPSDVSILQDTSDLSVFDFEEIAAGDLVKPLDVVAAASNEPDYGLDIGLFEDSGTDFGKLYGFGVQPFGNPGLDYGTQAPFHMGFYHESPIIYFFATFLKQAYPEYRIHLFKSLSEFAFNHGQDYWGWRFMGWGLHYMGDLSQPYHTTALPGYSPLCMIWIDLLDMLGWSTPKDNAVQLSSNRHVALETFEGILLVNATLSNNTQDVTLAAMLESRTIPEYSDSVPRDLLSAASHAMANELDAAIAKYMPAHFVLDPSVELGDVPERYQIIQMIEAEHGADAVAKLEQLQAEALSSFAIYGRSYVQAILNPAKKSVAPEPAKGRPLPSLVDLLLSFVNHAIEGR